MAEAYQSLSLLVIYALYTDSHNIHLINYLVLTRLCDYQEGAPLAIYAPYKLLYTSSHCQDRSLFRSLDSPSGIGGPLLTERGQLLVATSCRTGVITYFPLIRIEKHRPFVKHISRHEPAAGFLSSSTEYILYKLLRKSERRHVAPQALYTQKSYLSLHDKLFPDGDYRQ